jgi:acyl carrier protein
MAITIDDFIKKIEEEFDELEPGKLKPESIFRDIFDWNSINALVLIAMIKTEYDVAINADDLVKAKTVQDVFNVVKTRYKEA